MNEQGIADAALAKHTAAEQTAYLDQACGGDRGLRQRVEALLQTEQLSRASQETPAGPGVTAAFDSSTDVQDVAAPNEPLPTATTDGTAALPANLELPFLQPTTRPDSLGRLGHYEVLQLLGKGGFGIVLKAFDEKLCRLVAIKVLGPQLAGNPTARKRFVREARSAAAVRDEHVVKVFDVEERPRPYLVMEYVAGQTLQDRVDQVGPLPAEAVVRIGAQIAAGLTAAHRQGEVHRDIKPANILLENGTDLAKITDFGLARAVDDVSLTQSGVIAGTPMYMSPEQARGEALDPRSDLFSLGSVLYTLCTGHAPFRAATTLGVLKRVCDAIPRPIPEVNAAIPGWLAALVGKLLAKEPTGRIQTATEVSELLERGLAHLLDPSVPAPIVEFPVPALMPQAVPPRQQQRQYRWSRWHGVAAVGLGGVSVAVAGLYAFLFLSSWLDSGSSPVPITLGPPDAGQQLAPVGGGPPRNEAAQMGRLQVALQQGNLDEAATVVHESIEQDPNNAAAHVALGMVLALQEKLDEAGSAFRRATEISPDNFMAQRFLGVVLLQQGKPDEAVVALRRADELRPGDAEIKKSLAQAERLVAAQANLPRFLRGEHTPRTSEERLSLAEAFQSKHRYRTAVRLYAEAFADNAQTAEDPGNAHRYNAACCAARAAVGQGEDAAGLDDAEKTRLRKQAATWLRADLDRISERVKGVDPEPARTVVVTLRHWQQDKDLAGLRAGQQLAALPDEEQQTWKQLWADVEKVLTARQAEADRDAKVRVAAVEGRWQEVKALLSQSLETAPENHNTWCHAACLAAYRGDAEEYARCRTQLLKRFGTTELPQVAERVAKACLVLPNEGEDLSSAVRLAQLAASKGEAGHWIQPFALFAQALAEYRRGNLDAAEASARKAVAGKQNLWHVTAPSHLVLAMVQQRRGQAAEARGSLAQAVTVLDSKVPDPRSAVMLDGNWKDWLLCQMLRREAEALIEGK